MGSFRISRTLRRCLQKKRNSDPMPRRKKTGRTRGRRTDGLFSDFEDSPTLPSKKEEQRSDATEKKDGKNEGKKDRWALFGFRGLSDVAFKKRGTAIRCHGEKRREERGEEGQMGSFRISRTLRRCLQKKRNSD